MLMGMHIGRRTEGAYDLVKLSDVKLHLGTSKERHLEYAPCTRSCPVMH